MRAADPPLEPGAHGLPHVLRQLEGKLLRERRLDDCRGDDVVGGLLERAGETKHLVGALAGRRFDCDQPRAADGERAGLVEHDGVDAGERLQRAAALDQNAVARRLRDAGDEGDRRREDQRAGRRRDHHREAADGIAGEEPSRARDRERRRQQQEGITVGEADEGSLRGLRRRYHAHDAGIGARPRRRGRAHLEGLAGIERTAQRRLAGPPRHRDRLAGQRRLVDDGGGAGDDAVDRDDFAGAHENGIADRDRLDRHVFEKAVGAVPMRDAGRAVNQGFEVALGAGDREVLEHVAARIHHRDDDAGEVLAEQQSRGHRHEGDGIDADAAGEKVAQHRDEQSGGDGNGAERPRPARGAGAPRNPKGEAGGERNKRDRNQAAPQHAFQVHRAPSVPIGTVLPTLVVRFARHCFVAAMT